MQTVFCCIAICYLICFHEYMWLSSLQRELLINLSIWTEIRCHNFVNFGMVLNMCEAQNAVRIMSTNACVPLNYSIIITLCVSIIWLIFVMYILLAVYIIVYLIYSSLTAVLYAYYFLMRVGKPFCILLWCTVPLYWVQIFLLPVQL